MGSVMVGVVGKTRGERGVGEGAVAERATRNPPNRTTAAEPTKREKGFTVTRREGGRGRLKRLQNPWHGLSAADRRGPAERAYHGD